MPSSTNPEFGTAVGIPPAEREQTHNPFGRQGRPDAMLHWVLLGVAVSVLVAATLLQVRDGEQVLLPVVDVPLPGVCTYKSFVGTECPGCGLTRCFVSLAHGNVVAAWNFNPAGLLFFGLVAAQLPFRLLQIWRIRRGDPELRLPWLSNLLLFGLVFTLFAQWVLRTLLGFG